MAMIFATTCGTCGAAVANSAKKKAYDHVSAIYGGAKNTHEVTTVVSTLVEEAA
jgi:hypothetical protein